MWGQPPPAVRGAKLRFRDLALIFLRKPAPLRRSYPGSGVSLAGSVLARKCSYAPGANFLLLQFSAARAQGVSDNYVIHETKAPPDRRLRRARNPGLGRKLQGFLCEPDV